MTWIVRKSITVISFQFLKREIFKSGADLRNVKEAFASSLS